MADIMLNVKIDPNLVCQYWLQVSMLTPSVIIAIFVIFDNG